MGDSCTTIPYDVSTGRPRPWIPAFLRRHVFGLFHDLSHSTRRAPRRLLTKKFVWHGISCDAMNWARSCSSCQISKVHWHIERGPGTFHQPQRRFAHVHVDVVGPFPLSAGHRYLFTITDRSTRWPEAVPIPDVPSASCTAALFSRMPDSAF